MKRLIGLLIISTLFLVSACSQGEKPVEGTEVYSLKFTLLSPMVSKMKPMPVGLLGCKGGDVSPELDWIGVPGDAKSIAIVFSSINNSSSANWILVNIPAVWNGITPSQGSLQNQLPKMTFNIPVTPLTPHIVDGSVKGKYIGPCESVNKNSVYTFTAYAMKETYLPLPKVATTDQVVRLIKSNSIDKSEIVVTA